MSIAILDCAQKVRNPFPMKLTNAEEQFSKSPQMLLPVADGLLKFQ